MTPADTPILVLAGGRATRLAHLAQDRPKYLQPITETQTFADVHLKWLRAQGFRRVFLSLGYLAEMIESHCGNGSAYDLDIHYLNDGAQPLGTGGAVAAALRYQFETLAVTYGDTLLRFDLEGLYRGFSASRLAAAMTLFRNTVPGHACNADLDAQFARYDKARPNADWSYIDYGFLLLTRGSIQAFPACTPLDLAEPLSALAKRNEVFGFEVAERFWEIGTPEALTEFREAYQSSHFAKPLRPSLAKIE